MLIADRMDNPGAMTGPSTAAYRSCYAAARAGGASIMDAQAKCRDLIPGDVGSTSIIRNFVTGFELPSAPQIGSGLGEALAPVNKTLWLVLAVAVAVIVIAHEV